MKFDQGNFSDAYFSKEISTNDAFPQYLKQEVNDALVRVKNYINDDCISFAFITDIHHTCCQSDEVRLTRAINVYQSINNEIGPLPLVIGGDHTGDGSVGYKNEMFKKLYEKFDGINYLPVNGNHDDGTIWGMLHPDIEFHDNYLSHKDLFSLFYTELKHRGCEVEGDDKLYYWYDDRKNKVRYITLDVNDVPYIYDGNKKLKYNGQHLFILSQEQLDWLGNKALNFSENGWNVVLLLHGIKPDNDENATFENLIVLKELIGGFKNNAKVNFEFGQGDLKRKISFDFTDYMKADIVGYFTGDAHDNLCFRDKFDIPYIVTANAFPFYYDPPTLERYDGEPSEICINLMTINKKEHKIYVTNIGYGYDYVCNY